MRLSERYKTSRGLHSETGQLRNGNLRTIERPLLGFRGR